MIDLSDVTERLPAVRRIGRVRTTAIHWIPGLRRDAPKRNFVLLIAYLELLLFGMTLLRHAL